MKIIHDVRRSWSSAARRGARALLLLAASGMLAWAAPQGATVVKGNVAIANSGNLTTITASNNSIINYTGFNILPAEIVRFIQPGATARVYNEVNSPNPSVIAGQLLANGQVYIFNPSGIVFANGCIVNAGAIYAAAAKLSEQNFVNGVNYFSGASGAVVNNGTISGQAVVLFGSTVLNTGTILAPKGFVVLAAGNDLYLCEDGSHVMVKLAGAAATGQSGAANAGGTAAPQATASLGAGDLYSILVHNTGTVQAQDITLQASATGAVKVEGTLDASNTAPGGVGGTVNVLGGEVDLVGAHINASGDAGGGTVLIGGDLHGQSGTPTTQITTVDQNSSIKADAISTGNGGEVVVWSDLATLFYGQISARGGAQGGNGGLVETSGHYLDVSGARIDTSAPKGTTGTWLLDPYDITIDTTDATTWTPAISATYLSSILTDIPPSYLNVADLETALSSTNVLVQTGSGGTGLGNITVSSPIAWSSGFSLTLDAINNINVNASITGTGAGNLNLWAGNSVSISAPISLGGILTVNGYSADGYGATFTSPPTVTFSVPSTASNPAVTTAGGQTYNGPVTLDADTYLLDTASSNITFNSTVDAASPYAQSLYASTLGNEVFNGPVGSVNPLEYLVTDSFGLGGSVGGQAQFNMTAPGGAYPAGVNAETVTINDAVSFNVTGSSTTTPSVQTSDGQSYNGAVTLSAPAILTDSGPGVVFYSTVDGGFSLTVNGDAEFNGAVGSNVPLQTVHVTGTTDFYWDAYSSGTASVQTTGDQNYDGPVTLHAGTSLDADYTGNGVVFGSTLDSDSDTTPRQLALYSNAQFFGTAGGTHALSSLYVDGTAYIATGTITTTTSNGGYGQAEFNGAVVVEDGVSVNITVPGTSGPGGTYGASFISTVNGETLGTGSLTVTGNALFEGAIGNVTSLSSLDVTGITAMDAGTVATTGGQTYNGAVTLGADTALTDTGPGVTFNSTVNSVTATSQVPYSLTVNGNAAFNGSVGSIEPLSYLDVTGTTAMNAGTVTTSAGQTYNGAVTLGASTILTDTGAGVTFDSTVDGGYSLEVNGNAAFGGAVGSLTPLLALEVIGTTEMDAGTVTTTGVQIYYGAVTLSLDTALATDGASTHDLLFGSSINGAHSLTLDAGAFGDILVEGAIGNTNALTSLTVADSNGTTFAGPVSAGTIALLNTTGAITFGGDVTATSLITAAQPYVIVFDGDNIITNPVTFLNAGGVVNGAAFFGNIVTAIPDMTAQPAQWYDPTSYPESLALSPADLEALRNMGIWVRNLTPGEIAGLLLDNQRLVTDLPMKANPDPSDFTVAVNRLPARETQNLLAQYRGIFWKGGLYQADAICASFERALADYHKLGAKFTPGNFAEYVLGHQDSDAYRYGAGIKSLLTTLGSLGLTSRDFRAAKEVLLNRVKPADLSTVDFARIIEGL